MRRDWYALGAAALLSCLGAREVAAIPPPKIQPDPPAAEKPIGGITVKMTGVAGELAKDQTGQPVQVKETAIVQDLDTLIASLEKECANCRGPKKNNPTKPLHDSVIRGGTGGIGNLVEPGGSNKDWAKLSSRERDRILQSMSEGFPPEYRTVLERYYRRLAEEKAAPAPGASAQHKADESPADKP